MTNTLDLFFDDPPAAPPTMSAPEPSEVVETMLHARKLLETEGEPTPGKSVEKSTVFMRLHENVFPDPERLRRGLCQSCAANATIPPGEAIRQHVFETDPDTGIRHWKRNNAGEPIFEPATFPAHLREKYPPLWCRSCWAEDRYREYL